MYCFLQGITSVEGFSLRQKLVFAHRTKKLLGKLPISPVFIHLGSCKPGINIDGRTDELTDNLVE